MDLQSELLQKVWQYLLDEINLDELQDWFVPYWSFFAMLTPDNPAYELAGEIELGLSELGNEDIDESEFKSMISKLAGDNEIVFIKYGEHPQLRLATSSTSKIKIVKAPWVSYVTYQSIAM